MVEKKADLFKEIIPSILQTKRIEITKDNEKDYNAYIVNKALSFHIDTIMYANQMNMIPNTDGIMQYHYLLNKVRAYKRSFQKWQKLEKNLDLETIKEYYNVSNEKAKEILTILNTNQIEMIKKELYKGGIQKNTK